jgi:hypothetical protein
MVVAHNRVIRERFFYPLPALPRFCTAEIQCASLYGAKAEFIGQLLGNSLNVRWGGILHNVKNVYSLHKPVID